MNETNQNNDKPEERKELAEELKSFFSHISPYIEKHTAIICPDCKNLCCRDKHGRYDKYDIVFLEALGIDPRQEQNGRGETDSCHYINETGCSLERWMRPYRCTFFFCDALLESLENDNAKFYRSFRMYLEQLVSLRQKLLD